MNICLQLLLFFLVCFSDSLLLTTSTSFRSMRFCAEPSRLMFRFRPIAPKPAGAEATSVTSTVTGRRLKRKYVRVRGRQAKRSAKSKLNGGGEQPSPPEKSGVEDAPPPIQRGAVTLQLLGERSGSEEKSCGVTTPRTREDWKKDDGFSSKITAESGGGAVGGGSENETWMIVECVTEEFTGVRLGFSDEEKIYNLEQDMCPGFVSDWGNNVIWVNQPYKKMVAAEEAKKGIVVCLVVKDKLPRFCPSFACRVRVTQQKGQGQKWNKIVPCDVWRMEFGGFAWKLDVNTALSLGY